MKIGIFDPYLDDLGGGEKYMMMVAECLAKHHKVSVLWDKEKDISAFKKRFGISLDNIQIRKNIFSPRFSFFERFLVSKSYDALVVLSDGSIPFVFPTKLFLHIQQPLSNQQQLSFKDKMKLRYVSAIFYNSEFTKHFNEHIFAGVKNQIIYPPVNLESGVKSNDFKKENTIIHVGRFRVNNLSTGDYKKQGFMIDAFKKLVDSGFKNWKFIILSSVREEDEEAFADLRKKAKGYPIEFQINKTNQELFDFYNKAKIYWHASGFGEDLVKHPELAEHFGMTTVEAMGAGVVPVVINRGGQPEIVTNEKNGLLWDTMEELMQQTKRLATDEKLLHALSHQARIRARDFSVEKFCEAINNLIK